MKHSDDIQLMDRLPSSGRWKGAGALPVAVFLSLMIFLNAWESSAVFESPILLALLNTVFLCIIPLVIAYMAAKSHHATGVFAFLMVGCGLVFFGVSSLYAGWVMPLAGNPNPTVTLHNLGSLFAGICQFVGAHFFLQELTGISETKPRRIQRYWILYAGIFILVSITALLAFWGNLPVFFDPLTGASPLRQLVLGTAICLFAVSGLAFVEIHATTKTEFAYWYGLALWLIAIGLTCVLLQPSVGSMIGWTGRAAQYLGGVYFILAFLWGHRELPATDSSTAGSDWTLWPYLEHKLGERTAALVQTNQVLQKEIAERKRSEEQLLKTRILLQASIESPQGMIIMAIDRYYKYLTFNNTHKTAMQSAYAKDVEIGMNVLDCITSDEDREKAKRNYDRAMSGESHSTVEVYGDVERSYFESFYNPIFDEQHEIIGITAFAMDVTARKQAEEALRENEQNLRVLFETMTEGIALNEIIYDENGEMVDYRILSVNPAFYSLADYSGKDVIGGLATKLYGMSPEFIKEFWKQHKQKNSTAYKEMDSSISNKIFFIATSPFVNDRFVTSFIDITERRQAEEKLRESEDRYHRLVENVPDIVYKFSNQRGGIYYSPRVEQVLGYSAQHLYAHPMLWNESIHPEDRPRIAAIIGDFEVGKLFDIEYRIQDAQGNWRWLRDRSIGRAVGGGEVLIEGLATDITARKQAEEKLRENEERFRTILQTAMDGFWQTDMQGYLLDVNESYCRMSGYSAQELLTMRIPDLESVESASYTVAHIQKIIEHGVDRFESRHRRKDGSVFDVDISVQYQPGADGRMVAFLQDITDRKRAGEELAQSHALLTNLASLVPGVIYQYRLYPDGRSVFPYSSPGMNDIYEVTPEEVREDATPVFGRLHPDDYNRVADSIQESARTLDTFYCEFRVILPRQGLRWRWSQAQPERMDDGGALWYGIISDITERKRAEEILRESEASLKFSQQVAHVGHWTWDTVTNRVVWSDEMKRVFGLNPDTFDGDLAKVIAQAIHPDDREKVDAANISVLTEQKPVPLEYRVIWRDGSVHTVWAEAGKRILDADGKILKLSGIVQDITQRKQYEIQIESQLKRLNALHTIDTAISSSFDPRNTLDIFLREVIAQLKIDAASVLLFNRLTKTLDYTASRGFHSSAIRHTKLSLGQGFAGRVLLEHRTIHIPNLEKEKNTLVDSLSLAGENFATYIGVPLIAKGEIVGVLEVFHRTPLDPESEWLDFLEILAGQAAIAVDNAQLFENLKRSNVDLTLAYDATIEGWSRAMDLRDRETEGHTQRVTALTLKLARQIGIPETDLVHIRRGALLHDIGKLGVPDSILFKPGKLTDEEWKIMRQHSIYANDMLASIAYLKAALDIPYCHHEKWDGTGYPRGLKGEEIPLAARIFAVVDVWDALYSNRPYREAWPVPKIREYIRAESGMHFDPRVVDMFMELNIEVI